MRPPPSVVILLHLVLLLQCLLLPCVQGARLGNGRSLRLLKGFDPKHHPGNTRYSEPKDAQPRDDDHKELPLPRVHEDYYGPMNHKPKHHKH
ncbi:hypothetical protein MLD38_014959 [Melastoma candidum]|uniref:Uncharacterized protein n=1 Tax=Melastoma candidum TaxID=119954 RepID=A0ACB9REE8_9MYRT|nr:hypothetical protein MLD38_014959 [Melastoma candidum]